LFTTNFFLQSGPDNCEHDLSRSESDSYSVHLWDRLCSGGWQWREGHRVQAEEPHRWR